MTPFARSLFFLAALGLGEFHAAAQDITPPRLISASSVDGLHIGVCFSETMSTLELDNPLRYQVADSNPVSVVLQPGHQAVVLTLASPVSGAVSVRATLLSDLAGNPISSQVVTAQVGALPASLAFADIGSPTPPGNVISCQESELNVSAGGNNIGGGSDQFTYVYASRTNNFDVRVRVDGLLFVGQATAKAGIHIRQSLDAGSPFFMAYVTPTNGANQILVRARTDPFLNTIEFNQPPSLDAFPLWLRVNRSGRTLTALISRDGQSWEVVGGSLSIAPSSAVLLVGLGTVSRLNGVATTAEYRDFSDTPLHPGALITITQQPTNATLEANLSATFNVAASVTGAPANAIGYQWQAEDSPGSGVFTNAWFATAPSYTIPLLKEADSGIRVRVLVSISGHPPVVSDAATLTVNPDISAPHAVSAVGTRNLREIIVTFSEPIEPGFAQQTLFYNVSGNSVSGAVLDRTGLKVVLTLDSKLAPGSTSVVEIAEVRDLAGHVIDPNPQSISVVAFVLARGFAAQELYFDIPSYDIASLRSAEKFPNAPDHSGYVSLLEGPLNAYDDYGTRLSGFLVPPVSTNYHFFLASDDEGEFWLSTDDEPANLVRLCSEPIWMESRGYTNITSGGQMLRNASAPENRSTTLFPAGIPLVAGRMYYFEALAKDSGGGDNLAVAWQMPGMPLPDTGSLPISSEFLAVMAPAGAAVQILKQPEDVLYDFNPPPPASVFVESFAAGDGGYSVVNDRVQEPWTYNAASGYWFVNGSDMNDPSSSALTSPPFLVSQSGPLILRFNHRYSFEYDGVRWDGGQVRLSVNSGPFLPVGTAGFCAQGYAGIITGNNELNGQMGFNGDSPGYASGNLITSAANLGRFNAGDVLQIRFLAAWDENFQASLPNWLIDEVNLAAGECVAPVTFSVLASGSVPGGTAPPIHYQWQRDCGSGFSNISGATAASYSFLPVPADLACQLRVIVGTLGTSVTSAVARITIPPIQLQVRQVGPQVAISWAGPGTLQNAVEITGPWVTVGGVVSNTVNVLPTAPRRFYRVRVP